MTCVHIHILILGELLTLQNKKNMKPKVNHITIDNNLDRIKQFINEVVIAPRLVLANWAKVTKQTPAAKIGYIGQHLASLVTGVPGTGSGARGDDLEDGSEVKSCNRVYQVDKCNNCGARVLRIETRCPYCESDDIKRNNDSKWLFSIRDQHELDQYMNLDRVVLLLMDYPNFDKYDFKDIRITVYEIYPKDTRMKVFKELLSNHYYNIFLPKQEENKKTNPMNLHPWSFQFYKCNPIKTFECVIQDVDSNPVISIDSSSYVEPSRERDELLKPIPMPSNLLKSGEWDELIGKADYDKEIKPLLDSSYFQQSKLSNLSKSQFAQLTKKEKSEALPFLDERLRDYISLRPIVSVVQKKHYQRG